MMTEITLRDVTRTMDEHDTRRIREIWRTTADERESIRPSDLVGVVADKDALWLLCHLAPESLAREVACDWAERALHLAGVTDERSWRAIDVARRYTRGEATQGELDAARASAMAPAWDDARVAARAAAADAAWVVAWDAARTASWVAAGDVAWAAWDAVKDAAWAAAMRGMLLDLAERMEDER